MKSSDTYSEYELAVLEEWQMQILEKCRKTDPQFYLKLFLTQQIGQLSVKIFGNLNIFDYIKVCLHVIYLKLHKKSQLSIFDVTSLEFITKLIGKKAIKLFFSDQLQSEKNSNNYSVRRLRHLVNLKMPGESSRKILNLFESDLKVFSKTEGLVVNQLDGEVVETNSQGFFRKYLTSWQPFEYISVDFTGLIFVDGSLVINDPGADLSQDFVSGFWEHVIGHPNNSKFATTKDPQILENVYESNAVIGVGRSASNYWHCVMEYIPAITKAIQESGFKRVVWSASSPATATEILRTILPEIELIELKAKQRIHVSNGIVPLLGTASFDDMRFPTIDWCGMDFENILSTYSGFNDSMPRTIAGKRILLLRSANVLYRKVRNFQDLVNDAELLGFEVIDPAQLSLIEQIQIFQTSDEIWSFGGAVWANLIFANKETKFVNLVSRPMSLYLVHRYFAKIKNLKMKTFILDSDANFEPWTSFRDYMHRDIAYKSGDLQRIILLS